jgi:hypothetical protein
VHQWQGEASSSSQQQQQQWQDESSLSTQQQWQDKSSSWLGRRNSNSSNGKTSHHCRHNSNGKTSRRRDWVDSTATAAMAVVATETAAMANSNGKTSCHHPDMQLDRLFYSIYSTTTSDSRQIREMYAFSWSRAQQWVFMILLTCFSISLNDSPAAAKSASAPLLSNSWYVSM